MVPYEDGPLEGLLDVEDQETPWMSGPRDGDNRSPDYLMKEIMTRVNEQENPSPHFRLQIRCKQKPTKETKNIYYAMFWSDVSWENEPWEDFAIITLTSTLGDSAQQQMQMNVSNLPPCLSILKPTWSSHPAWIMHARTKIYPTLRYTLFE